MSVQHGGQPPFTGPVVPVSRFDSFVASLQRRFSKKTVFMFFNAPMQKAPDAKVNRQTGLVTFDEPVGWLKDTRSFRLDDMTLEPSYVALTFAFKVPIQNRRTYSSVVGGKPKIAELKSLPRMKPTEDAKVALNRRLFVAIARDINGNLKVVSHLGNFKGGYEPWQLKVPPFLSSFESAGATKYVFVKNDDLRLFIDAEGRSNIDTLIDQAMGMAKSVLGSETEPTPGAMIETPYLSRGSTGNWCRRIEWSMDENGRARMTMELGRPFPREAVLLPDDDIDTWALPVDLFDEANAETRKRLTNG